MPSEKHASRARGERQKGAVEISLPSSPGPPELFADDASSAGAPLTNKGRVAGHVSTLASLAGLSSRESQALYLAAIGMETKATASRLRCSPKTIDTYWSRIFAKTGFRSRLEAVAWLLEEGLARTKPPRSP